MSEGVHDLLIRGVAAARGGERAEARNYLEWVLSRPDAADDQRIEAWINLAEISEDPAEKRDCYENVLAYEPGNVEARHALALLDGRLRREDILDPVRPQQPVGATPTVPDILRYTCPNCGGKTSFSPGQAALFCPYCGSRFTQAVPAPVDERDFIATLPTAGAHRWELPQQRVLSCAGCGATVTLPPGESSAVCLFCGSAHVAIVAARRDLLQPWGVAPFAFDANTALDLVRQWLRDSRLRSADLEANGWLYQPRPLYMPFWTFDINVQIDWCGVVPQHDSPGLKAAMMLRGTPVVHKYPYRRVNGSHVELFDDILVPAGRHLPPALLDELSDFDTHHLAPYSPDFLASWPAEIYHVSLADASIDAHAHARAVATENARKAPDLREVQELQFTGGGGVSINSFKLVLLPVWLSGLEFEGQHYTIAVNGQTRTVASEVPRNPIKNLFGKVFGAN